MDAIWEHFSEAQRNILYLHKHWLVAMEELKYLLDGNKSLLQEMEVLEMERQEKIPRREEYKRTRLQQKLILWINASARHHYHNTAMSEYIISTYGTMSLSQGLDGIGRFEPSAYTKFAITQSESKISLSERMTPVRFADHGCTDKQFIRGHEVL